MKHSHLCLDCGLCNNEVLIFVVVHAVECKWLRSVLVIQWTVFLVDVQPGLPHMEVNSRGEWARLAYCGHNQIQYILHCLHNTYLTYTLQ